MQLILKMTNAGIYVEKGRLIPFSQTNLPKGTYLFNQEDATYWLVFLQCSQGILWANVLDYEFNNHSLFDTQGFVYTIIELNFENLNWEIINKQLKGFKAQGTSLLTNGYGINKKLSAIEQSRGSFWGETNTSWRKFIEAEEPQIPNPQKKRRQSKQTDVIQPITESWENISTTKQTIQAIDIHFTVPFMQVEFHDGYVSFIAHIKQVDRRMFFRVANPYVKKEFETVKKWFKKKLEINSINVSANVLLHEDLPAAKNATSIEIQAINSDLIEKTKEYRTLFLTGKTPVKPGKSLYTTDDIFAAIQSEEKGNAFDQSDTETVQILIKKNTVRSRKQLEYLSERHAAEVKLRFTLKPNFGFVFLLQNAGTNYFIWELLETHATYIWSVSEAEGNTEDQYKQVEYIISQINTNGRNAYRSNFKFGSTDGQFRFYSIDHTDDGGFKKWKTNLEAITGIND
jgi:hypothetical protein